MNGALLKNLAKALSGSLMTTAYSSPQANGYSNIPPQATFKNFFSTFIASLNNAPGNSSFPSGNSFNGTQGPVQNQFQGQFPTQMTNQNISVQRKGLKAFVPGLYNPGASVINLAGSQPQQNIPPQFQGGAVSPIQALIGVGGTGLQGSASQLGQGPSIPSQGGFPVIGQPAMGQGSFNSGGIIGSLIMPVISLISALASILKVRKFVTAFSPARVNQNNLNYMQYQGYLRDTEATEEGSFDNVDSYQTQESQSPLVDDNLAALQGLGAF